MSRRQRTRPTGAAAVIGAMIGALALTGCGAGQATETSSQVSAVDGANADAGTIAVRNARIAFGDEVGGGTVHSRGGSAALRMSIVNAGAAADRLISATSPVASSVQISGGDEIPGGRVLVIDGEPSDPSAVAGAVEVPATPIPAAPPAAPGEVPATSPVPIPTAAPTPTTGAVARNETYVVLTGLRDDIRAGLTYEVVLTFANAGAVRLQVPVENPLVSREVEPAT